MRTHTSDFSAWAKARLARIEDTLEGLLATPDAALARLYEGMRYSALGGGKRVRALLCLAAAEWAGAREDHALAAAAAIEMVHAYSLVHDDLPCMDDDDLRRGRPTCHVRYGEATALLVGDGLQARAIETLTDPALGLPPAAALALARTLAAAAGPHGMVGGQAIDIEHVGQPMARAALEQMHSLKTGALIRAAVRMGALCGGAGEAELAALDAFAAAIGLAFQVVDDILDVVASTDQLGKTAGKDQDADKPTYVSLLGLDGAQALAGELKARAWARLDALPGDTRALRQLADFVISRQS